MKHTDDRDLPGMHDSYQYLSSGGLIQASTFWTPSIAASQGEGIYKWRVFEVVMEYSIESSFVTYSPSTFSIK